MPGHMWRRALDLRAGMGWRGVNLLRTLLLATGAGSELRPESPQPLWPLRELMLPGDEVVLLLTPIAAHAPEYRAVYGAGVQFIRNGRSSGESAKRYGWMDRASQTRGGRRSIHSSP